MNRARLVLAAIFCILSWSIQHGAALAQSPSVTTQNVWVEHNIVRNGEKGLLIHARLSVAGCKDVKLRENAYFQLQNGPGLRAKSGPYSTPAGYVVASQTFTPGYASATYNDFQLFMPYDQLNMQRGSYKLCFNLAFYVETGNNNMPLIGKSQSVNFNYSR